MIKNDEGSHENMHTSFGTALVVGSSFLYATYGVLSKLMGDFFGGYSASALRSLLIIVILIPVAYFMRKLEPFHYRNHWKKLLAVMFFSPFVWGPFYYAVQKMGVGVTLTINYAAIIVGMIFFGYLFAGEKLTSVKIWSAVVGMVGLVIVSVPTFSTHLQLLPIFAATISGLSMAGVTVGVKQLPYNTMQSTVVLWTASVIANIPMALLLGESVPAFAWQIEWLYLVLFAIVSIVASWMLLKGMRYIEAGFAGILGLMEIVFAVFLGIVLFGEKVTILAWVGIAVIIFAAVIPFLAIRRSHH